MTTHLLKPFTPAAAPLLRCGLFMSDAPKGDFLGSEDGVPGIDCAGCLRDLVVELRLALSGDEESAEMRWRHGGDTGTSSLTIWSVMTGHRMPPGRTPCVPWDPGDFGRCHRLLELFPNWRARMSTVAERYPDWAPLVAEWSALTALYLEEFPSGRAPRLYERLRVLTKDAGR